MKKLLSLLSVLTISGTAVQTTIAASPYQKEEKKLLNSDIKNLKRIKRGDAPSLQNMITTINIGEIEKVNQKNILKRLSEINHPIVSRPDFLENVEFENITANSAIVRASRNIGIPGEINSIASSIRFTINFDSNLINFNELLGVTNENAILNFGNIIDNRPETIANQFIQRYGLDDLLTVDDLVITNLRSGSASIESLNINYLLSIDIIFISNYLSLRTFITNTNLGNLRSNSEQNIVDQIKRINSLNYCNKDIRLEVRNITRNSADILFSQATNSSSSLHCFHSSGNFDFNDVLNISFHAEKIDLSSIITNKKLGIVENLRPETIFNSILSRNPNCNLTINDINISLPIHMENNDFRAWIGGSYINQFYENQLLISFSLPSLSSVIINTNLSDILDNRPETIIREVIRRNPNSNLTVDDLIVRNITRNSATIEANNFINQSIRVRFNPSIRTLDTVIINLDLGIIPDNRPETIIREVIRRNPNSNLTVDDLIVRNITRNSATITSISEDFIGTVLVNFTINNKNSNNKRPSDFYNDKKDDKDKFKKRKDNYNQQNVVNKQLLTTTQKLNEISQHYQTLSENGNKDFIDKLKAIGSAAIGAGVSGVGTKMIVSGSTSANIGAEATGETIEMTPLLSEGGLTVAETLSVAEGTAVVATEGAVIGAEAGAAAALAPETLGLSLVTGGLAIAGTAIIWMIKWSWQ